MTRQILARLGFFDNIGGGVQRVDGAYLYGVGTALQPIHDLEDKEHPRINLYVLCSHAHEVIRGLIYNSVFKEVMQTAFMSGSALLQTLSEIVPDNLEDINWQESIPAWRIVALKSNCRKFETVLSAQLTIIPLFFVSNKGGFDTQCLTDRGDTLFPATLASKVPGGY